MSRRRHQQQRRARTHAVRVAAEQIRALRRLDRRFWRGYVDPTPEWESALRFALGLPGERLSLPVSVASVPPSSGYHFRWATEPLDLNDDLERYLREKTSRDLVRAVADLRGLTDLIASTGPGREPDGWVYDGRFGGRLGPVLEAQAAEPDVEGL